MDSYDGVFINSKSDTGIAVANKVATYEDRANETGEIVETKVTNLDLHNKYRNDRGSVPFKYRRGWFPKTYKLREEYAKWGIFNKSY